MGNLRQRLERLERDHQPTRFKPVLVWSHEREEDVLRRERVMPLPSDTMLLVVTGEIVKQDYRPPSSDLEELRGIDKDDDLVVTDKIERRREPATPPRASRRDPDLSQERREDRRYKHPLSGY